jgi:hypothetical protein
MFSVVYGRSKTQFHSISFQNFWPVEICLRWNEARLVSVSLGQDRFFILPSSFLSKRGIPVITVIALTTPAPTLSTLAAARTQRPLSSFATSPVV